MAEQSSALHDLIRRGRRRQKSHLLIHSASLAAVVALAGAILLLIVGAQILNWYWLVVLFAGALAAGIYRSRTKLLSSYQIAQSIDRQLDFKDALSTAYYFSRHPERSASPEFIAHQRQAAEDVARSADIERGVPFLLPRTAYANLALVAVVFGMFGLRYGIHRNLDLGSPLVRISFEGLFGTPPQVASAKSGKRQVDADGNRDPSQPADPSDAKTNDLDPATKEALQSAANPDPNSAGSPESSAKSGDKSSDQVPPGSNPLDPGEKGESSLPNDANANAPGADSKSGQQNASNQEPKDSNQAGSSGENSSLTGKLRDALSNLLAKLKTPPKTGGGKPSDSSQSASAQNSQQGEKQEGDAKSPGQEQADASSTAQSPGEQQQGGTEQASQGKSEGRSNRQPNSPDGKSGIGKQDGDKSAREAAELAAMGKLSEIIGKRDANITGEVMVEVSSGKQQLKTQYSQQSATHTEAGGEINRDEVPLAYQQYVQQYFAQVRKLPASKSKAAPSSGSKQKSAPSSAP